MNPTDASAPTPLTPDLIDINKTNLARAIAFADFYDSKAKFILTILLAVTGYFLAELPSFIAAHAKYPRDAWFVLIDVFAAACLVLFLVASFLVVWSIRPNTNQHSQKVSPFFFQSIAVQPLDEFRAIMTSLNHGDAIAFLVEQTYDNAKVVARKHTIVRRSFNCFLIGMACFILFSVGRAILLAVY